MDEIFKEKSNALFAFKNFKNKLEKEIKTNKKCLDQILVRNASTMSFRNIVMILGFEDNLVRLTHLNRLGSLKKKRIIIEKVRIILSKTRLQKNLLLEAVNIVDYVVNKSPFQANQGKTLEELF